jgi:hypothetical protein
MNHKAAYEMIDPSLKPRLDEWMKTHQPRKCTRKANVLGGDGPRPRGGVVYFDCHIRYIGVYSLVVDGIVIEDMKVVDWGEIREEINFREVSTFR